MYENQLLLWTVYVLLLLLSLRFVINKLFHELYYDVFLVDSLFILTYQLLEWRKLNHRWSGALSRLRFQVIMHLLNHLHLLLLVHHEVLVPRLLSQKGKLPFKNRESFRIDRNWFRFEDIILFFSVTGHKVL